jgi:naphthalene 1,2-dioxygenase system ferredoxin subunit
MNPDDWTDVAALADLWDGVPTAAQAHGVAVALYRVADEVFATDLQCSHGNARLCDGFLEGHEIECPLHQGRFDVRTGQATAAPACVALRCHPVQVVAGRVRVGRA